MIITICGSHRFDSAIMKYYVDLTMKGHAAFIPAMLNNTHWFDPCFAERDLLRTPIRNMLRRVHRDKIDLSDAIFVVNSDGYIGEDTKAEIEYARATNTPVYYAEEINGIDMNPDDIWNR